LRPEDPPAYVLTARGTFSGAEESTYNLQNLKRATVVGETTGAGAHPVAGHRIDDNFMIGVRTDAGMTLVGNHGGWMRRRKFS